MKAVIMAGGEGSRLRPLTCDMPKPMARLCGRPILEYIMDLLLLHKMEEAAVTLRYLPERIIEHFPDESYRGLRLAFVEETKPLGTAGSVKNACPDDADSVLVISGDALCDFDLTAAAQFHQQQGADVTVIAKRVANPTEYGIIRADETGRIEGFLEKPAFSQALSDLANTGIYLLSPAALALIPSDKSYDFAKDLFPLMLEKGMKLMCCESKGYWCDIGDLDTYISCQKDMLMGRVACDIHGNRDEQGNVWQDTPPKGRYHIKAPIYMGNNVRMEDGVMLESGTVVDDGAFLGQHARITGSILLPGCHIDQDCRLTASLVGAGATLKKGAMLFESTAVGAGAIVGRGTSVLPGIKIWNGKSVADGLVISQHVKNNVGEKGFFGDDGITGQIGVEITPEFCARLGSALGSLKTGARIGIGCSGNLSASVMKAALAAGIQATGSHVMDFGENFRSLFEYGINFCTLNLGVFLAGGENTSIRLVTSGGLPATREQERQLEGIFARGEFVRCAHNEMGDSVDFSGIDVMYKSQLLKLAPKGLAGLSVQIKSHNVLVQNTMRDVLQKAGCDLWEGFVVELSAQGERVCVKTDSATISHEQVLAWCCLDAFERGEDVALPFEAPRTIEVLAERYHKRLLRYYDCPADSSDNEARQLAATQLWSRDGLMLAVKFLAMVKRLGGIQVLVDNMPRFVMAEQTVELTESPASVMRRIPAEKERKISEGVLLRLDKGTVLVKPMKRGTGIRILAEAVSTELAEELCVDVKKLLQQQE